GRVGAEDARELVMLSASVSSLAGAGRLGFAALAEDGELVYGTFDGAGFARTRVADLAKGAFVVANGTDVLIANGSRLLRWRAASGSTPTEVVDLSAPIERVLHTPT